MEQNYNMHNEIEQLEQQIAIAKSIGATLESCEQNINGLQSLIEEQCYNQQISEVYEDNVLKLEMTINELRQCADNCDLLIEKLDEDALDENQLQQIIGILLENRYYLVSEFVLISQLLVNEIDEKIEQESFLCLSKAKVTCEASELADCNINSELIETNFFSKNEVNISLYDFTVELLKPQVSNNVNSDELLATMFAVPLLFPKLLRLEITEKSKKYLNDFGEFAIINGELIENKAVLDEQYSQQFAHTFDLLYYEIVMLLRQNTRFSHSSLEKETNYTQVVNHIINVNERVKQLELDNINSYKKAEFKVRQKLITGLEAKNVTNFHVCESYEEETHYLEFLSIQLLKFYVYEYNNELEFIKNAVGAIKEQYPDNEYNILQISQTSNALAEAIASEILESAFLYVSELICQYVKESETELENMFCVFDLIETMNVFEYFQNKIIFSDSPQENILNTSAPMQYIADWKNKELTNNLISESYYNLSESGQSPNQFINFVITFAYEEVVDLGKKFIEELDKSLFNVKPSFSQKAVIIDYAPLVLNSLQKMIMTLKGIMLLNPNLDVCKQDYEYLDESISIPKVSGSNEFQIIENRVYFLVVYIIECVCYKEDELINLLEKINTVSYIEDFVTNEQSLIYKCVSDELKQIIANVLTKLVEEYNEMWLNLEATIKIDLLSEALLHVYDKWLTNNEVSKLDYDEIVEEVKIYKKQKENLYQEETEIISTEAKITGFDVDQQTDSGLSVESTTNYNNDGEKEYSKLRSKRLFEVIEDFNTCFLKDFENILKGHEDFHVQNKHTVLKLREEVDITVDKYELFESICELSPVTEKYYEELVKYTAEEVEKKCKVLFE